LALIIVYCYLLLDIARNWSHKRRTSPQGPKIVAESWKQRWTSWGRSLSPGRSDENKRFWGHENTL